MRTMILPVLLSTALAASEMPSGPSSAEGAATDLQSALLYGNREGYQRTQNPKLLKNKELADYADKRTFLLERERPRIGALNEKPRDIGPAILTVKRMGRLSAAGANETAKKEFGFREIGFVDVDVREKERHPEMGPQTSTRRMFVMLDADGKWYALERLDFFPALTQGCRDEKPTDEAVWKREQPPATPAVNVKKKLLEELK